MPILIKWVFTLVAYIRKQVLSWWVLIANVMSVGFIGIRRFTNGLHDNATLNQKGHTSWNNLKPMR